MSDSEALLTVAHQAPLFMGFSRQEYWSGLPFLPPGDLSDPGIESRPPALQANSLPAESAGKPMSGVRRGELPQTLWCTFLQVCRECETLYQCHFSGLYLCFPGGSEVKATSRNVGDPGSIPGLGRSPGEGNGNPLQYSCLENPMDGGAW